jgi:hypothetical protein
MKGGAYIKSQKVSLMFHFYKRDTSGKQSKYQNQDKLSYETEMCSFVRGQKVSPWVNLQAIKCSE